MKLALLEDWIAIEDVADLAEVGPALRWLDARGLLDLSRLSKCLSCGVPFVQAERSPNQRYCSIPCRRRFYRRVTEERYPGRELELSRAKRAAKVAA